MLLSPDEARLFFKLQRPLLFFVNQRLQMVPTKPRQLSVQLTLDECVKVRNGLTENMDLIESFVAENPAGLSEDELDIVRSWRHLVAGEFSVFRYLRKHTILLSHGEQARAFGVLALKQPLEELVRHQLPVLVRTVLLPFRNKIVYDGVLLTVGISAGRKMRRLLNELYNAQKSAYGIVTSLPVPAQPAVPPRAPRTKPRRAIDPKAEIARKLGTIIKMIDLFCGKYLNEEYAVVCRRLAEKLARKRPSPLLKGEPITWAGGIVRTIGWVNFLNDKAQKPYMPLSEIDALFGVSESTGAARSAAIRKVLKITQHDSEWILPSYMDDHPLIWMVRVSGFVVDVRFMPKDVQEQAFEKGLIPYVPESRSRPAIRGLPDSNQAPAPIPIEARFRQRSSMPGQQSLFDDESRANDPEHRF